VAAHSQTIPQGTLGGIGFVGNVNQPSILPSFLMAVLR